MDHSDFLDGLRHRVQRPAWTCVVCDETWPCMAARRAMVHWHADEMADLHAGMLAALRTLDHEVLAVDRRALYRDFAQWSRPEVRCPACGSDQHVAVPGVPPRLVPCDELRALMAGGSRDAGAIGAAN